MGSIADVFSVFVRGILKEGVEIKSHVTNARKLG